MQHLGSTSQDRAHVALVITSLQRRQRGLLLCDQNILPDINRTFINEYQTAGLPAS
jgi:hypothetical protein